MLGMCTIDGFDRVLSCQLLCWFSPCISIVALFGIAVIGVLTNGTSGAGVSFRGHLGLASDVSTSAKSLSIFSLRWLERDLLDTDDPGGLERGEDFLLFTEVLCLSLKTLE